MNNKYHLNLIDITVSFEGFLALNKLNLNLKKGELRAVTVSYTHLRAHET